MSNGYMLCRIIGLANPFVDLLKPGNEIARACFLLFFEKHHSNQTICYACGKYHQTWIKEPEKNRRWTLKETTNTCKEINKSFSQKIYLGRMEKTWTEYHNLMRSLKYPMKFGGPYHFNHARVHSFLCTWNHECLALLIDGHLIVRVKTYGGFRKSHAVQGWLERESCPHIKAIWNRKDFVDDIKRALKEIKRLEEPSFMNEFEYKIWRCPYCPTEISIAIQPLSLFQGRISNRTMHETDVDMVIVSEYRDLGDLNSPDCIFWKSLTDWHLNSEPAFRSTPNFKRTSSQGHDRSRIDRSTQGSIRARFEKTLNHLPTVDSSTDASKSP